MAFSIRALSRIWPVVTAGLLPAAAVVLVARYSFGFGYTYFKNPKPGCQWSLTETTGNNCPDIGIGDSYCSDCPGGTCLPLASVTVPGAGCVLIGNNLNGGPSPCLTGCGHP